MERLFDHLYFDLVVKMQVYWFETRLKQMDTNIISKHKLQKFKFLWNLKKWFLESFLDLFRCQSIPSIVTMVLKVADMWYWACDILPLIDT